MPPKRKLLECISANIQPRRSKRVKTAGQPVFSISDTKSKNQDLYSIAQSNSGTGIAPCDNAAAITIA